MPHSTFARIAFILCIVSMPASAALGQIQAGKDKLPAGVALRLGSTHLRHARGVYPAAFSPDGKLIATSSGWDNLFCLWDAADGKLLFSVPARNRENMAADVFSHDGKWLAGRGKNAIYLWDIAKRENRLVLPIGAAADESLHAPIFSPDDKVLAVPCVRGPVRLFDVATGKLQHILPCAVWTSGVVFLPDCKTLVTAEKWAVLRFWDLATGKKLREVELKDDHYFADGLAVSPDGKLLAINQGGTIAQSSKPELPHLFRMIELETGKERYRLSQNQDEGWVYVNVFTPDGKHLLRGIQDGKDLSKSRIELLEPATGKVASSMPVSGWGVQSIHFSADGRTLMAYGNDNVARLWSFPDLKQRLPHTGHTAEVSSLAFSADGKLLCSSGQDNKVIFWDLATGQPRHVWPVAAGWWREAWACADGNHFVCAVNHTNSGRHMATDGKVIVYKVATGEQVQKLEPVRGAMALSPDGKTLAATDANHEIRLWNFLTGKEITRFQGQGDETISLVFSPDGQGLAATSDGTLRIWWTATGQLYRTIQYGYSLPRNGAPRILQKADLAFSADGLFLAVTTFAKAIEIWDVLTGTQVQSSDRRVMQIFRHFPIADSRVIVKKKQPFGGDDPVFFDIFRARPLGAVPDWASRSEVLALAPNGRTLAAPELDGLILIAHTADIMKSPPPVAIPAPRIDDLWANLRLQNSVGYQAFQALADGDKDVVAFLAARLEPIPVVPISVVTFALYPEGVTSTSPGSR